MIRLTCDAEIEAARLEARSSEAHRAMVDSIRRSADVALDTVRAESPVASGDYRDAWEVVPTDDGAELRNDVPYAEFVDVDVDAAIPADTETQAADAFERALEV